MLFSNVYWRAPSNQRLANRGDPFIYYAKSIPLFIAQDTDQDRCEDIPLAGIG